MSIGVRSVVVGMRWVEVPPGEWTSAPFVMFRTLTSADLALKLQQHVVTRDDHGVVHSEWVDVQLSQGD